MLINPQSGQSPQRLRFNLSREGVHLCEPEDPCPECKEYWHAVTSSGLWDPTSREWNWEKIRGRSSDGTLASLRPVGGLKAKYVLSGKSAEMKELEQKFAQAQKNES